MSDFEEEFAEFPQETNKKPEKRYLGLSESELNSIFLAKCQDFGLVANDKFFQRFLNNQCKKSFEKVFEMDYCSLGPKACALVAQIVFYHPHIKIVSIAGNSLGNKGSLSFADLILHSKSVISLDLSSNSISDKGAQLIFQAMQQNKFIVTLNIGSSTGVSRNSFGNGAAQELSRVLETNEVLSELDISMTEITSDTVKIISEGLGKNKTLQYLNISNNNIQSSGAKRFISACMFSQIVNLNLSNNHIKDDFSSSLVKYMTANKSLRVLNLSGNSLTKQFIKAISDPLSSVSMLTELNISHNPITGVGADLLGPALSTNRILKVLNIAMCQIGSPGFESFCSKLENNKSLTSLFLSHNPIGDSGAERLATALKRHNTLREIDLELCEITNDGGVALINAIAHSPSLERVSLKNNLIRNGLLLQKALAENHKIQNLNIEFNDIDYKFFNEVQRMVRQNLKKFQDGKKQRVENAISNMSDVQERLQETRTKIIEERDAIRVLNDQLNELRVISKNAEEHKISTLTNLDDKLAQISQEVSKALNDFRENYRASTSFNESKELEVAHLTKKFEREIDNYKRDIGALQGLETRINEYKQKSQQEMQDIENRYAAATLRHKDATDMFMESWKLAKGDKKKKPQKELSVSDVVKSNKSSTSKI